MNDKEYLIKQCQAIAQTLKELAPFCFYDKEQDSYYFDDILGGYYYVGLDGKYNGVRLIAAFGGPNIFIDTNTGRIEGYWWGDEWSEVLNADTINAIDDYWKEDYNNMRGL